MAVTINPYQGARGSEDFTGSARPTNFREMVAKMYPQGAPLTALLSKAGSEAVDDPKFTWFEEFLPYQRGTITGVYTSSNLSSAYASGGVAGTQLFLKMAANDAKNFRPKHQVLLRAGESGATPAYPSVDTVAEVLAVNINGASSYVNVRLLEADDNGSDVSKDLSDANTLLVVGSAHSELDERPEAIAYDPNERFNYTQIFRNSLELSGTAMETHLRYGTTAYKRKKSQIAELHSIELEKAFIWGIRTQGTGANGKPKRTTGGLVYWIKANASDNVKDYSLDTDTDFTGKAWTVGGKKWLDERLEVIFRYGNKTKMAFAGTGAMLGINQLAETYGQINLQVGAKIFGINITEWLTPFGTLKLLMHPLFSHESSDRNTLLIFEPERLIYRPLKNRDTRFISQRDKDTTDEGLDGKVEEFKTECGLECHFPETGGYLTGIGKDNTQ